MNWWFGRKSAPEGRGFLPSFLQGETGAGFARGYRVRDAAARGGLRELREVELIEVSVVADPMQPRARIHAIE